MRKSWWKCNIYSALLFKMLQMINPSQRNKKLIAESVAKTAQRKQCSTREIYGFYFDGGLLGKVFATPKPQVKSCVPRQRPFFVETLAYLLTWFQKIVKSVSRWSNHLQKSIRVMIKQRLITQANLVAAEAWTLYNCLQLLSKTAKSIIKSFSSFIFLKSFFHLPRNGAN